MWPYAHTFLKRVLCKGGGGREGGWHKNSKWSDPAQTFRIWCLWVGYTSAKKWDRLHHSWQSAKFLQISKYLSWKKSDRGPVTWRMFLVPWGTFDINFMEIDRFSEKIKDQYFYRLISTSQTQRNRILQGRFGCQDFHLNEIKRARGIQNNDRKLIPEVAGSTPRQCQTFLLASVERLIVLPFALEQRET